VERLQALYSGEQVKDILVKRLDDKDEDIVIIVAKYLGDIGAKEYGATLLRKFQDSKGLVASNCAVGLGLMHYEQAVPVFVERLNKKYNLEEFLGIVDALGDIQTEKAYNALQELALLYQNDTDMTLGPIAHALLQHGNLADIDLLVGLYYKQPERKVGNRILDAFSSATREKSYNFYFEDILRGKTRKASEVLRDECKRLGIEINSSFFKNLQKCFKREDYREAYRILEQQARTALISREIPLNEGVGYDELQQFAKRDDVLWYTFIKAFAAHEDNKARKEDVLASEIALLIVCFLNLMEYHDDREVLESPGTDVATLIGILQREKEHLPPEVMKRLIDSGEEAVEPLMKVMQDDIGSWGAIRAAHILRHIAHPKAIPVLLEGLSCEENDTIPEECMQALGKIGEPVLDYADDILTKGNRSQIIYLLGVLTLIPDERSVDILLKHFDMLIADYKDPLLNTIEDLGDRRFIEPLRGEVKENELDAEEVFLLLCDLHSVTFPELNRIRRDLREHQDKVKERTGVWTSGDRSLEEIFEEDATEGLRLKLKCRQCRYEYIYDVGTVFCDLDTMEKHRKGKSVDAEEEFVITKQIVCKHCGAVDDYKFTSEAMLAITAETMKSLFLAEQGKKEKAMEVSRVKYVTFGLKDGQKMHPKKAIAYYHQRIANDPQNPTLRISLGNVLKFLGKYDEAITEYKTAIELNPNDMEPYYNLGNIYMEREDFGKARRMFNKVLDLLPSQPLDRKTKEAFREATESALLEINDILGDDLLTYIPDLPEPVKVEQKVGRNDPCPCGSGKKYKKCCGK